MPELCPLRLVQMQLSAARARAADEPWDRPNDRAEQPRNEADESYKARRCYSCQGPFAPYGFGPPMTRPGGELWACPNHKDELRQALSTQSERRTDPAQTKLL